MTPYMREVWHKPGDENAEIVITMNSPAGHSNAEVLQAYENIGKIVFVWLPPHGFHLFRISSLDLLWKENWKFSWFWQIMVEKV